MLFNSAEFHPELREDGFLDLEKRANDVIRALAAEHKVALVDAAAAIPAGPAHFADFVHFTDKGAALMAGLVANTILKAPPLTASPLNAGGAAGTVPSDERIPRK